MLLVQSVVVMSLAVVSWHAVAAFAKIKAVALFALDVSPAYRIADGIDRSLKFASCFLGSASWNYEVAL